MKKILALGLCICMTAAVSACGSGQGQTAAGTVPAQAAVEKTAEGSGGETGTPDGNTEGAGAAGETLSLIHILERLSKRGAFVCINITVCR